MNRTEAKARAVELGISKDVARQYGNLNKTQTWLDAISAYETQMQTQEAAEAQPASDLPPAECELSVVDGQPMQIDAVVSETRTAILEETAIASGQSYPNDSTAIATIPSEVCVAIATEQIDSDEIASDLIAPTESAPMFADPWDEADEAVALPKMLYSTESRPMYSVSEAATLAKSAMPDSKNTLQFPALEPSKAPSETTDAFAPVYPILLFCIAVWALSWATVKLLMGLGFCLKLGLTHLVKQLNSVMNERSEPAQQPEGSGIGAEQVRLLRKLPKESPQPPRTAIP